MKKLIILILFTVIVTNAQDSEPEPWNFRWGYSDIYRPFSPDSIKQKSVLTGFQWGGSINMNDALHNNVWTGGDYNTNHLTIIILL